MTARRRAVSVLLTGALAFTVAVGLLATSYGPTHGQDKGQLVVVSWGGSYQDAQREAWFRPFEKETGIKMIEQSPPSLAKIKAMVTTGNTEWDLVEVTGGAFFTMLDQKLMEPLDFTVIDKDAFFETVVHPYGVGSIFTAFVIGYNTKAFPRGRHPRSWAEFWDAKKFPGPRSVVSGERGNTNAMELALLADGVPRDNLYPLDLERAWRGLEKIQPHVTKWTATAGEAAQGLVDGRVVLAVALNNRLEALKQQGAPVDYEWNEAMIIWTYWAIPKGARNKANAMKFLSYLSRRPEVHARLASLMPIGPVVKKAVEMLDPKVAALVPNSPENIRRGFFNSPQYWAEKTPSGKTHIEEYVARWNAWRLK